LWTFSADPNYLLSNGEYLFVYCSTQLHYLIRQAPFAAAHLIDEDITVDFQALTNQTDRVAIIATLPLTDNEVWTNIQSGELMVFQDGRPLNLRFTEELINCQTPGDRQTPTP
jgi:glutamine amidotransferase